MSARANAFSIASLMSAGEAGVEGLMGLGSYPGMVPNNGGVPQQRSTDCFFDWGNNNMYMPSLKSMEGENMEHHEDCYLLLFVN